LGYGVNAVGAAGQVGRGELEGPAAAFAELGDLFGVGGDQQVIELRAGLCGLEDPGEHRPSGDGAKDLTGEPGGGEAGRNDAENCGRLLFVLPGIKYY
ncbi:MAG TPA: hypothetical protein VK608_04350, partial [Edaphobacter sp.]|nr:hypothetical protein [Edaphobacter sp.]